MSVAVLEKPILMYAGDTFVQSFRVPGANLAARGSWSSQWRETPSSPDGVELVVSVVAETITITLPKESVLAAGQSGVIDVQCTNGSVVSTLVRFATQWMEDVTR